MPKLATMCTLNKLNVEFFDVQSLTHKPTGESCDGYICEKLTDDQRRKLATYPNVILSKVTYQYAPEIVYSLVVLFDHPITVNSYPQMSYEIPCEQG